MRNKGQCNEYDNVINYNIKTIISYKIIIITERFINVNNLISLMRQLPILVTLFNKNMCIICLHFILVILHLVGHVNRGNTCT